MSADRFLYEMRRWEEDIAEHPQALAEFANQTRMLNNLERLQRDLNKLSEVLKRGTNQ